LKLFLDPNEDQRVFEGKEEGSPAFLILDRERAKEEIQSIVKKVEDIILS